MEEVITKPSSLFNEKRILLDRLEETTLKLNHLLKEG